MGAMNELTVNIQHSILTLAGNGWSNRRIARELGINRETVGKYLVLARSKPAISTPAPRLTQIQNQPFRSPALNQLQIQNQPFRPPGQPPVARAFASRTQPRSWRRWQWG